LSLHLDVYGKIHLGGHRKSKGLHPRSQASQLVDPYRMVELISWRVFAGSAVGVGAPPSGPAGDDAGNSSYHVIFIKNASRRALSARKFPDQQQRVSAQQIDFDAFDRS
jgi:hypothetical protein